MNNNENRPILICTNVRQYPIVPECAEFAKRHEDGTEETIGFFLPKEDLDAYVTETTKLINELYDKIDELKKGNYPEKQDNPNELMDFVKFCRNASEGCIVYINNRARDLIAKFKEKRVSVKQNGEMLDTKSVASNQLNAKLTYADIEKMVKPLEWKYISNLKAHYASTNKGMFFEIYKGNGDYVLSIDGNNPVAFSEKLSKIKQAAQEFLVDLVAAALGVERSGE